MKLTLIQKKWLDSTFQKNEIKKYAETLKEDLTKVRLNRVSP